jgi:filamentous hemagglutinin family protein
MNRIYRLVWNQILNIWVAVSEHANGRGKSIAGRKLVAAALALTASGLLAPLARAEPTGGQISAGTGSIAQAGTQTTITQSSQNLAINWQDFSIAANEAVRFNQPDASAIALNRVLGQNPSRISGSLSANGQVFVLNPNGVLFSATAQVNVGGLVASTLSLGDADFMAGKHTFSKGGTAGSVVNQGTLTAEQGGYIALLAPEVRNEGVIRATLGTALLGAGDKVTLNLNHGSLLGYSIDQGALNALADNQQLIQADGGQVFMSAKAANALGTAMVNNTGIIEARTVQNVAGVIMLIGDMQVGSVHVGGTLDASAPNGGNGGFIETSAAYVKVADDAKVTTAAPTGLSGTWLIDPVDFTIAATGGDITGATLTTSLGAGNVVIQSTSGGAGTAGDVNVNDVVAWSANKLTLNAQRNININANLNGSGTASLALEYGFGALTADYVIAPNVQVNLPAGSNFSTKLGSSGIVKNYTIITSLGTAGSTTGTDLQGMSGNLAGYFALGSNIDATVTSGWNAGAGFVPVGDLTTKFTGVFDGLGHTVSNPTINRPTTDYVGLFGYTSGSIIRNAGLMGGSVSGRDFVGGLVGLNWGTVDNSYATGNVSSGHKNVGGLAGATLGAMSNVWATSNVSNASGGIGFVGGLVGNSGTGGTITNAYATGTVSGTGPNVGGLVGFNSVSTISNAYATGSVSGTTIVGGLVGSGAGVVTNSYATGSVSGTGNYVGGLVGYHYAGCTITNSYATGNVSGPSFVGGLVGNNAGTVSSSYWNSSVIATGIGGGTMTGATGRTAADMMLMASFAGFDIANTSGMGAVWRIYEGNTTPWLTHFLKPLTVTANNDNKTYSGAPYSGGNGVTYSVASPSPALSGTLAYGGTSQSAVNAGSYTLSASGLYSVQQGYDIRYAAGTLTINKAHLTVTADDKSRLYGAANPALTTTVSGFVNGENAGTATGFTGAGSATTLANATTNAGAAVITTGAGNLAATNYAFTNLVNGTLTINPVPLAEIIPPVAGGILPAVVQAITALPGGADLLPAFRSTVTVAAAHVDAMPPPVALSNLQYVYLTTTTPGAPSGNLEAAAEAPTKVRGTQSDGFNERLADAPIQFTGTVLVRNGGILLPGGITASNPNSKNAR